MSVFDGIGGDAINAALALWLKNQNDKAPKTYNVPPTPTEAWQFDQIKSLYPDLAARAGTMMQGMNQAPDFKFHSPIFQGDKFAGGLTYPKMDFSQLKGPLKTTSASPTQTPTSAGNGGTALGSGVSYGGGATRIQPSNKNFYTDGDQPVQGGPFDTGMGGSGPRNGETIYDYITRTNAGPGQLNQAFPSAPTKPGAQPGDAVPGQPGMTYGSASAISTAFEQFKKDHPNWSAFGVNAVSAALAATLGLPGALIGRLIQNWFKSPSTPTAPNPGATPGTVPASNGKPPAIGYTP